MKAFLPYQVAFMGGCCGTSPEHIRALRQGTANYVPEPRQVPVLGRLSSREQIVEIGGETLPKMIGERINPTARKKLAQALRDGDLALIQTEAEQQTEAGAHILDVNVGTHGIDEAKAMEDLVNLLQQSCNTPLCLDSTNAAVLERGLKQYHGRALVNSVNGEQAVLDTLLPVIKRYGAAVVGLTLDETGIPETAEGRLAIGQRIVDHCLQHGIRREDIYLDSLVMTVGTNIDGPRETLRTMKCLKEQLGVHLLLGVSNVSHGLPNRAKINSAFLAMAIGNGLDLAIMNPLEEMMKNAWQSASLLAGRDVHAENYVTHNSIQEEAKDPAGTDETPSLEAVTRAVVKGSVNIDKMVQALLDGGTAPMEIINHALIPGLNDVGEKYEKGIFFLPQLMRSAETAQKAFQVLESRLESGDGHQKGTMVIGTVKGDIHDIGKNMVAVMVKNHGYRVIDLGKNVPAEDFVAAVKEHQAQFLGLSALMTTTMQEIPKIIALIRQKAPATKILIGGAVVTEEFAAEVGADGYGKDAIQTVKIMDKYVEEDARC